MNKVGNFYCFPGNIWNYLKEKGPPEVRGHMEGAVKWLTRQVLLGLSLLSPKECAVPLKFFLLQEKISRVGRIQSDSMLSSLTSAKPSY